MISEILISIICVYAIFQGIFSLKKNNFTGISLLWFSAWFLIIIFVNTSFVGKFLNKFDIVISLIILFVVMISTTLLSLYLKSSKNQEQMTHLVRELSLKKK